MIQYLPEWAVFEKLEEDPIALAWIDELVDHKAERHDQIDAAYLRGTVAGGSPHFPLLQAELKVRSSLYNARGTAAFPLTVDCPLPLRIAPMLLALCRATAL